MEGSVRFVGPAKTSGRRQIIDLPVIDEAAILRAHEEVARGIEVGAMNERRAGLSADAAVVLDPVKRAEQIPVTGR